MNHIHDNKVSCFTQKHSVVKLQPTKHTHAHVSQCHNGLHTSYGSPYKSSTTNRICQYEARSGFEPETPVTVGGQRHATAPLPLRKSPGILCKAGRVGPGPVWMGSVNLAPTGVQSVVSRYTNYAVLEHCNDKIHTLHSDDSVKACLVSCGLFFGIFVQMIIMTIRHEFCAESARNYFIC
jgi:hypothetical protein